MHPIFVAQDNAANIALAQNSKKIQARRTCLITKSAAQIPVHLARLATDPFRLVSAARPTARRRDDDV